ncbi:protein of unknown function [Streptococcus thermophilus]|nr:protein of unknown function [Streptococcus thermophilus]
MSGRQPAGLRLTSRQARPLPLSTQFLNEILGTLKTLKNAFLSL